MKLIYIYNDLLQVSAKHMVILREVDGHVFGQNM